MKAVDELSGRELDACVASEVMGLEIVHYEWPQGPRPEGCQWEARHFMSKEEAESLDVPLGSFDQEYGPVYSPYDHAWPPAEYEGWQAEVDGKLYQDPSVRFYCGVEPVPFYSTDIAAAWRVVEKVGNNMWVAPASNGHGWIAGRLSDEVPDFSSPYYNPGTYADTAPMAICRAALKAVRANE